MTFESQPLHTLRAAGSRLQCHIRWRFCLAGFLALAGGGFLRLTFPVELPGNLFDWSEIYDDGLSSIEAAALAEELPTLASYAEPSRIEAAGIKGSLVIVGGGRLIPEVHQKLLTLAGGKEARLVIIPTASEGMSVEDSSITLKRLWQARGFEQIEILHTHAREAANSPEFVAPLKAATAVWICGGRQSLLAAAYTGTLVEKELHALLARGGVVGGTSAGAACLSRKMIVQGGVFHVPGFGLLPGAIIDQHFIARQRKPRLLAALEQNSSLVGFGVDEDTALVVTGRELRVIGPSTVTVCLAASKTRPVREIVLKEGNVADLTALRRAAIARTQETFPPSSVPEPVVPTGSLVIVGGGGMPKEVTEKFIELAGGPDSPIVVLPTAGDDPLPEKLREVSLFEQAGAKKVTPLRGRTPDVVESPEFLESLRQARGVWFGGGRQWRFVDAYEGTKVVEAFHDVLRRGGVIGGSSAGATIQAYYLSRGSPLGNTEMMSEGYERGFAFLPGTAIDQHFAQRKRFPDMTQLMNTFPQLLGIGIDESTAIVVRGSTAEVVGKNATHFYDRRKSTQAGNPDYETIASGGKYDLKLRKAIESE